MKKWMFRCLCGSLLLLFSISLIGIPQLSLSPNIRKGFEPIDLKLRVTLLPDADNRGMCVGYVNSDSGGELFSCRSLDGANEPKTFWYDYKRLPAGRYTLVAQVERSIQKPLEAQTVIEVLSTQ